MSYEFTRFYPAVCKRLGVDPSEASEALYWAILWQFDRLSDRGVLSGSFVSSVQEAVDAISAEEEFVARIDRIEAVRDGDLVTITIPVEVFDGFVYLIDAADSIYGPGQEFPSWMTFHYATRKGFHATQ